MGHYETAQICLNGHVITSGVETSPNMVKKYCPECGAPTTAKCEHCNTGIHGYYHMDGVVSLYNYSPPSYCHNCGKPYPWTETRIETARLLVQEDEQLSSTDKEILTSSIPDLLTETPKTKLATTRYKKLISKAVNVTGQGLRDLLVDLVSESVKKSLWP